MIGLYIIGGVLLYQLIGCGVFAAIDKDGRIFKWFEESKKSFTGALAGFLAWAFWPIAVYIYYKGK